MTAPDQSSKSPTPLDPFDQLLATSLRARPIPAPKLNLAAEALSRAKTLQLQDARLAQLARLKRWTRVATVAAILFIVDIFAFAYKLWPAYTDSTTAGTATSYTPDLTTIGIAAFIITLIIVALLMLFTPERPQVRLTPA